MRKCRICDSEIENTVQLLIPITGMIFKKEPSNGQNVEVNLHICPNCGLGQIENELSGRYYENYILLDIDDDCTDKYYTRSLKKFYKSQFSYFINFFSKESQLRILDIGCADGTTSDMLSEYFDVVDGVDVSLNYESSYKGNGIFYNSLFEDTAFNVCYDALFCADFLEHIFDVKKCVDKMYSVLKDGGYGMVMVPNGDRILNEGNWYDLVGEHLNYFSYNSLVQLFYSRGFEICECVSIRDGWWYRIVFYKRNEKLSVFEKKIVDLDTLIEITSRFKNISFWGAGVKGVCFISNVRNLDKYLYIFDSNITKENKYFPGINKAITCPDSKKVNENDLIIITALENKNEIIKSLKRDYDYKGYIVCIDNLEAIKLS